MSMTNYSPVNHCQIKAAIPTHMNHLYRVIPGFPSPLPGSPASSTSSFACNVLRSVDVTRVCGHIRDGGLIRIRLHSPARPNPVSCVAIAKTKLNPTPYRTLYQYSLTTMAFMAYAGYIDTLAMMYIETCSFRLRCQHPFSSASAKSKTYFDVERS